MIEYVSNFSSCFYILQCFSITKLIFDNNDKIPMRFLLNIPAARFSSIRAENCSPWVKFNMPLAFVNKVLLAHSFIT